MGESDGKQDANGKSLGANGDGKVVVEAETAGVTAGDDGLTYKDSGVDLEVYEQSMARLPRLMHRTFSPRVLQLDGGFAGLFELDFTSRLFARNYQSPVMVACTDGVGTKLKIACLTQLHDTVGIDLVAMCVNDAICCGAEPLFFLDYIAMSHDDPSLLEQIVEGISEGCLQSDCALIGGETAIMPDLYGNGDFDLAGFCVGVVERRDLIDGKSIAVGDTVIGLASSGIHSNGYSLVRRIVFDREGKNIDDPVEELGGKSVGEALLEPTRIYAQPIRKILAHYPVKNVVHGIAHITGGGLCENIARIMPTSTRAKLKLGSWPIPNIFPWLQRLGNVKDDEMFRVFNMGIGMAVIVSAYYADSVQRLLADAGVENWKIGEIEVGEQGAELT
ncbi:MAG TPA: phosphoribosylformylglycinamidine cyclo-ligase [Planctomycetaceae bacterium]|nr:phosphoribosylformylglycinamidine cyclo-ligase [Planctomycetaceae bacterium]